MLLISERFARFIAKLRMRVGSHDTIGWIFLLPRCIFVYTYIVALHQTSISSTIVNMGYFDTLVELYGLEHLKRLRRHYLNQPTE